MKADGIKPTSRAIRERLGNTGSMGTINKLLQRWKSGQERQAATALTVPPALQRAMLDFMDQELTAARAALEAELADQQQEAADLATENERQLEIIEARTEQLEALSIEKAAAEGKAGQLSADLDTTRDEAGRERQAAELARTELAKAQLRLESMPRLENDLAAVRNELAKERQARIEAEQSAAVLKAQKDDLTARLADAKTRADRADELAAKQQARGEQLAADLADCRLAVQGGDARIQALDKDLASARKDAEQARAEAKTAGEVAAELRGQIAAGQASAQATKKPGRSRAGRGSGSSSA